MRFPAYILACLSLFVILGIACKLVNPATNLVKEPVVETPFLAPTPVILFQDDFTNPFSGWSNYTDEGGANEFINGRLRMFVNLGNWYSWNNPGLVFGDVIIDVDAMKVSGPDQNDFGILCRYQDQSNFYRLAISSDGFSGISKMAQGKEQLIGMENLQQNTQVIHTGTGASNHIRAACIGDRLTLFANGQILAEVRDGDLVDGDVGLMAGSYDTPGVEILFDNFSVTRP